jgi:hypothetical protein
LLLVRSGGCWPHRHFSSDCGVGQTSLCRARGGRGLLGHTLIGLGDLPFTQYA